MHTLRCTTPRILEMPVRGIGCANRTKRIRLAGPYCNGKVKVRQALLVTCEGCRMRTFLKQARLVRPTAGGLETDSIPVKRYHRINNFPPKSGPRVAPRKFHAAHSSSRQALPLRPMRLRRVTLEATNALPPSSPTTRAMSRSLTTPERAKLPPVANEPARTPARDLPHLAQAKQAMKRTPRS